MNKFNEILVYNYDETNSGMWNEIFDLLKEKTKCRYF